MKNYHSAIERAYSHLAIDEKYGFPQRGLFRITLSLALSFPELIKSDFDFSADRELTPKRIVERPYVSHDPVGACISANLRTTQEELLAFPDSHLDRLRFFTDRSHLVQTNQAIFNAVIVVSAAFCAKHELRSGGRVTEESQLARLRMFRLCLLARKKERE